MSNEFERKFVHKDGFHAAVSFVSLQEITKISEIQQGYFIEQCAYISFDWSAEAWIVKMKDSELALIVPARKKELDELRGIIGAVQKNLVSIDKSSYRLRLKDGEVLFTAKFPEDKEFEYVLNISEANYHAWVDELPKVDKKRHLFVYDEQSFEFDLFGDQYKIDHLFEIEFETLEEKQSYIAPDFLIEVGYSNKMIALENYKAK